MKAATHDASRVTMLSRQVATAVTRGSRQTVMRNNVPQHNPIADLGAT